MKQTASSGQKKMLINSGASQGMLHPQAANSASTGTMQIQGHSGQNYKRIVNIYSVNSYKNKRRSNAPETRVHLNHSVLPSHGVQGKVGPYENRSRHGGEIQLPEIQGSKNSYGDAQSVGRPYNYKSTIDQQNSAMISKLMSRKKSYERMMKIEEPLALRSPQVVPSEAGAKRNPDALININRGNAVSGLSRANMGGSSKKQLQYFDSTPQQPRKNASVLKGG